MRYLANTSFIRAQTVTDNSPALRVRDVSRLQNAIAGTLSADELKVYAMMNATSLHNADTATASESTAEANSIYLGERWKEWNEDGVSSLCEKLEQAANLAELTLENSEINTAVYTQNTESEMIWMTDERAIDLLRTARRAIIRCNADSNKKAAYLHSLRRLNAVLHELTKREAYTLQDANDTTTADA